jgi:hypothetical protein
MITFQIPLVATPSQTLAVTLGNQSCVINVYQKRTGLYLDLSVKNALIVGGVICRDRVWMVQDSYLGFVGDLGFVDTQGLSDPGYTGLGTRFQLIWQG